jgi:isopentenyl-diphosphate Delta-isomerase
VIKKSTPSRIGGSSSTKDKEAHIHCCLKQDVESFHSTGFENYYLVNCPLLEIDFSEVTTSCFFLGKEISAPFIILPITGGSVLSTKINRNLAVAAHELGVVMSVGSQRLAIEDPSLATSYQVREFAPDVPLLANLGAIYLNYGYGLRECEMAVEMIGADALVLYLNPLQKIFQGSGKLNFKGLIDKIGYICDHLSVPVIVKDVGFGLSFESAKLLEEAGVRLLDVAGAGGTSWVKITRYLKHGFTNGTGACFDDWGTPTSDALINVIEAVKDIRVIASGGIRSGVDMAKALALGASYAGMALPLLAPAMDSPEAVKKTIESVLDELKTAVFCCGITDVSRLREGDYIRMRA